MYNFGKIPPRSVSGQGVSSVLGPNCRVFYDNLFVPAHLGRVSDLLAARLREHGLDELKLRAVLLFTFFEAYRSQSGVVSGGVLVDPLVVECGFDDEKVAVGIAFRVPEGESLQTQGLAERISEGKVSGQFEALLAEVYSQADHSLIRVDVANRKVELISLLAIPGRIELQERQPMSVIVLEEKSPQVSEAQEYTLLGDLDYAGLLREGRAKGAKNAASVGEVIASSLQTDDTIRIKGGSEQEETVHRIKGGEEKPADDRTEVFSVQSILKKVWPFSRKKVRLNSDEGDESGPSLVEASFDETAASEAVVPQGPENGGATTLKKIESAPLPQFEDGDIKAMTQYLVSDVSTGTFARIAETGQEKARELKRSSADASLKQWIEGFALEIVFEKARLMEVSRKISLAFRQKELEMQKREQGFGEELRRRDETVQQKTVALQRSKDQLAQVTAQLDKLKNAKGGSGDENSFRQKYNLSQRMVVSLREENSKLTAKLDETRNQMSNLQASQQKSADANTTAELAALKQKHETVTRQFTQMKIMNDQLLRRMQQESQKKTTEKAESAKVAAAGSDEAKRRLETATKLAAAQQKEIDQLQQKVSQMEQETTQLKGELHKSQQELRSQKKAG